MHLFYSQSSSLGIARLRGYLIGFENPEEWRKELLLRHPRFQVQVKQARQSLRAGRGHTLEEVHQPYR